MAWVVKREDNDGGARFQVRFRDADGVKRSAGTFASRREAVKAGRRVDAKVEDGSWIDPAAGRITFRDYVEQTWWPSRHLEVSTRAAYRSHLDRHFLPFFGHRAMRSISPSTVQTWVTEASAGGLSPRSLGKYHVMLHGIFKRAVRDRLILHNPCADTELPKVPPRKARILSPEEFERLLAEIPDRFRELLLTDIETGRLKRRLSDVVFRCLIQDLAAAGSPGGQVGASLQSSAADPVPMIDTLEQSQPGLNDDPTPSTAAAS